MKKFLDEDFLLENRTASKLYHDYAENMPVFDYFSHVDAKDVYENRRYASLTQLMLVDGHFGDHYKWRVMRQCGIQEEYITGNGSDEEKFLKFAEVMPYAIGNPLYHWTHLELKRYFGITETLSPLSAKRIYAAADSKLDNLTARKLIEMSNVRTLSTTDDPVDSLEWHVKLRADKTMKFAVLPSFKPDKCVNIELDGFLPWLKQLESVAENKIETLEGLETALDKRAEFFDSVGCVISDHSLDVVFYEPATRAEVEKIFKKALRGKKLSETDVAKYKTYILLYLGRLYKKYGWAQQYHVGALRNNSVRALKNVGADTGFDCVGDGAFAAKLAAILKTLDETDELPKTILYCVDPSENAVLSTLINCFQQEGVSGKIQFGSGWWFNNHKFGIENQLRELSSVALIGKYIGTLTDTRSLLSYSRHEYFRRILCNEFGKLIENGEYPDDIESVGKIVQDICYNNAVEYFKKSVTF